MSLYKLDPAYYARVRPLYTGLDYHLSIQAVLEGTVTGGVWVDDIEQPQAAYVQTPEGQYLAGDPTRLAFTQALATFLLDYPRVSLKYHPDAWEATFPALLAGKFARPYPRRFYTFQTPRIPDWRARLPAGYDLVPANAAFLARTDLANIAEVRERIGDWTDFARDGMGCCLVHANTIVCMCLGDCRNGRAGEVGIATQEAYRGRGLATLTVAATLEYCLAQGIDRIGWHCMANNWGSQRVAEKAGFALARDYVMYANQPVAEHAADLSPAEWQAHAEFFDRAFTILTRHSAVQGIEAAVAWAQAGAPDRAQAILHRLVDLGYFTPAHRAALAQSWGLQPLHTTPGWPVFLARLAPPAPDK